MNVSSNNISVFPTTLRESIDPAAKYTTEYNLTSLINKLIDKDAFVISNDVSVDTNKKLGSLDFNIIGYYFSIKDIDLNKIIGTNTSGYINASITIAEASYNNSNFNNWYQLQSNDNDDGNYTGLDLSYSPTNTFNIKENKNIDINPSNNDSFTGTQYTFTILKFTKDNEGNYKFEIPAESKIKFENSKDGIHHSIIIDDGEL